jgi:hypothetical protein
MESELMHTFGLGLCSLILIDNLPSLVGTVVLFPDNNLSTFIISASTDIKYLVVLDVSEELSFIDEDLPPS